MVSAMEKVAGWTCFGLLVRLPAWLCATSARIDAGARLTAGGR